MASERIEGTIRPREGSSASALLAAIRDYAVEKAGNPWLLVSRRPLALRHASPRAEGVRYVFARDKDGAVSLRVSGKRARLGLAYVVTLLANARLERHVKRVDLEVNR